MADAPEAYARCRAEGVAYGFRYIYFADLDLLVVSAGGGVWLTWEEFPTATGGRRKSVNLLALPMAASHQGPGLADLREVAAPTDDQTWLMVGGLCISIVWTMNLIYYHAEPHIWHDVQVRGKSQTTRNPGTFFTLLQV